MEYQEARSWVESFDLEARWVEDGDVLLEYIDMSSHEFRPEPNKMNLSLTVYGVVKLYSRSGKSRWRPLVAYSGCPGEILLSSVHEDDMKIDESLSIYRRIKGYRLRIEPTEPPELFCTRMSPQTRIRWSTPAELRFFLPACLSDQEFHLIEDQSASI